MERLEMPEFKGTLNEMTFDELKKVKPDIAFFLKQLSVEEEARKWLVQHVVDLHNAMARFQGILDSVAQRVDEMAELQNSDRRELAEYHEVTKANEKQIGTWKETLTTPFRIGLFFAGVLATAIVGALATKFIK